jgi:3-hydroxybutyryl-CoA dehydrogenase
MFISYVTALHAKIPVILHDPSPSVLSSALAKFETLLAKDVAKSRITKSVADEVRERLKGVRGDGTEGEIMPRDTDLVIEVSHQLSPSSST